MGEQRPCARPSLEEHYTAYMRTKRAAQHIEHTSKGGIVHDASEEPVKTVRDFISHPSTDFKAVDSVMENSTPAFTKSQDSDTQPGARSSTDSTFKPPTPLRNYRAEPKLWVDYDHRGGRAGKAIAEWKEKFVPLIHDVTKDMTIEERTEFFDRLIKEDEDRYLQPLATYYTFYPEHIPERELSVQQKCKLEEGMKELPPKMGTRQRRTFQRYFDGDWSWDPNRPAVNLEPDLGPRNERTPDNDFAICQHCISQARKEKAKKILKPVMTPVLAIHRRFSKSVEVRAGEGQSSEVLREMSDDDELSEGSSEKESKPRDVTETGLGMRRPMSMPARRRRGKEVDEGR